MPRKPKPPQEKKRLSLERDRRNTYGENDKSSRKNIPRSKAISHRAVRRTAKQQADQLGLMDEESIDVGQSTLTTKRLQKGKWKKWPDTPLGEVLREKRQREVRG